MNTKKLSVIILCFILTVFAVSGCGAKQPETTTAAPTQEQTSASETTVETTAAEETTAAPEAVLEDGVYTAEFNTDSSMFKVNDANEGIGILTVENGQMTIHISLMSKKILNLFPGTAEDAQKSGAVLLEPSIDTVTYPDGLSEEVHGFDVPVPYLDEEFDCALIGEKGKWYDHKVSVTNPVPYEEEAAAIEDGEYTIEVTLEGGSGKASVTSPCNITVKDGQITAAIEWSSSKYDFMVVDGETYYPVNTEGNSLFEIPVKSIDGPYEVQADTIAMSQPHLIDYVLNFDAQTLTAK